MMHHTYNFYSEGHTIHEHMASRIWAFFLFFSLLFLLAGYRFGDRLGLFLGTFFAFFFHFSLYRVGENRLLRIFSYKELRGRDPHQILEWTTEICKIQGHSIPKVRILETENVFGFAIVDPFRGATIAISDGALRKLKPIELKALVNYLVFLSIHLDSFRFGVLYMFVQILMGMSRILDRLLGFFAKRFFSARVTFFTQTLSPLINALYSFAIRQSKIFELDELASQKLENPRAYADMLHKLFGNSQVNPLKLDSNALNVFFAYPPYPPGKGLNSIKIHPSIDFRIRKIAGTYPV